MRKIFELLIIVIVMGCVKSQTNDSFTPVTFEVNETLLSEEIHISDAEWVMRMPIGLESFPDDILMSIADSIISDEPAIVNPEKVFFDQHSTFITIISNLSISDAAASIESYLSESKEKQPEITFHEGRFSHNQINFYQTIFSQKEIINIKLVFGVEARVWQIDYLLPIQEYEAKLAMIESSIGSIKKAKRRDA